MEQNTLIPFTFQEKQMRVLQINGDPWWVAKDVCEILRLDNSRDAVSRLDQDDVGSTDIMDSLGRMQQTSIINEPGLYTLIFGSRKTEAKVFMRWTTHEVLPSIRKTGTYGIPAQQLESLSKLARYSEQIDRLCGEVASVKQMISAIPILRAPDPSHKPDWTNLLKMLLSFKIDVDFGTYLTIAEMLSEITYQWDKRRFSRNGKIDHPYKTILSSYGIVFDFDKPYRDRYVLWISDSCERLTEIFNELYCIDCWEKYLEEIPGMVRYKVSFPGGYHMGTCIPYEHLWRISRNDGSII